MIKCFYLATGLVLASSMTSQACSPIPEVGTGVQYYRSITPTQYQNWFSPDLSVGLVYAKKKKTKKREVFSSDKNKPIKKPFVKIKFKLIEDISGDFIADETRWYPQMNDRIQKREHNLIGKPKDFAFWDRRDLTIPHTYGYSGNTSCGPSASDTLLPDQYYLHFKEKNRTIGFEIVSGPDDPLVEEFIQIQKGFVGSQIRRKPEDYFSEMNGFVEIKIMECPLLDKYEPGFGFIHQPWGPSDNLPKPFETIDIYKSEADNLNLIDFYAYITQINKYKLNCTPTDKYLVLDKLSRASSRGRTGPFSVMPPKHRFLKIKNNQINTDDILSRITIHSDEPINVDQIKAWIKKANPEG